MIMTMMPPVLLCKTQIFPSNDWCQLLANEGDDDVDTSCFLHQALIIPPDDDDEDPIVFKEDGMVRLQAYDTLLLKHSSFGCFT